MNVLMTAVQFTLSCLSAGMGLFLAAEAVHDVSRIRLTPDTGARALAALGGASLLALGAYGALLSVPL